MGRLLAAAALAVLGFGLPLGPANAKEDGAELFELCVQCHGTAGQGKALALAPAIAGLSEWYVKAQLEKFQSGARGLHPEDLAGLRMYPMARAIRSDAQIDALAAYVSALPAARPEPTLEGGDATRGKALYAPCAACHGPNGEGLQALEGPSLVRTNDWYLMTQLEHFKDGVRGANPKDASGMRMRPMAMVLGNEQAMKDVVAYLMSLPE